MTDGSTGDTERCRGCGADLTIHAPIEVHASVSGPDWEGVENADVSDPTDRIKECSICMTASPGAIDLDTDR